MAVSAVRFALGEGGSLRIEAQANIHRPVIVCLEREADLHGLSDIEKGLAVPSLTTLEKLAR